MQCNEKDPNSDPTIVFGRLKASGFVIKILFIVCVVCRRLAAEIGGEHIFAFPLMSQMNKLNIQKIYCEWFGFTYKDIYLEMVANKAYMVYVSILPSHRPDYPPTTE